MSNPFVLGVQYYGPPHTTEVDWERDFRRIKEHGLEAIHAWAIWGYLEAVAGMRYDRVSGVYELNALRQTTRIPLLALANWATRDVPIFEA